MLAAIWQETGIIDANNFPSIDLRVWPPSGAASLGVRKLPGLFEVFHV